MHGTWFSPAGRARQVRVKGGSGPLYEAFMGINQNRDTSDLKNRPGDLAYAYAAAVWAYSCIKLRADTVAGVPLELVDGDGEPMPDHPLQKMIDDVNPYTMNRGDLLRATESAYNIWGVGYWLMQRAWSVGAGAVVQSTPRWLQWLNPQTVEVKGGGPAGIESFEQRIGADTREFSPRDVVYFRNFHPSNDIGGLSPLSVALSEINADLNATAFVSAFFANDARPGGLLTTDQRMMDPDVERTRTWWQKLFGGAKNKWKVGIVGGGLQWQEIGYPIKDLVLRELREEDRRAIAAVFRVPPTLAGAWESANYATAREETARFYEGTIVPQLDYYAEVMNWSIVTQYPDLVEMGAELRWDLSSVSALQENTSEVAQRAVTLYSGDLVTRNEAREMIGLDTTPDGDQYKSEVGMAQAREIAGAQPAPQDNPRDNPQDNDPAVKAALDELGKAERFYSRRGMSPGRPFRWEHVPGSVVKALKRGLAAAETDAARRDVFEAARVKIRMEPTAVLPLPEVTEADIEAAERHWRAFFGEDGFADILDATLEA